MEHRATYSPEDNKIRIYPAYRFDKEDYLILKNGGFCWAPRQKIFVAPKWTPKREDLALKYCGEIGDEDTSLVERSEERADRFENYSIKREKEATQAHDGVKAITEHIPFGQPILIGHHSEKRARKDQERIENGMRKAVKLWETSEYWTYRAAGALRHAKYKERPDVRARRIKKIEAENRKYIASYTPKNPKERINQTPWSCPICGKYSCDEHPEAKIETPHVYCGRGNGWVAVNSLEGIKNYYSRWIKHNNNRLAYEKAMLGEQGRTDLIEKKARPKQLPMLNYKAPGGIKAKSYSYGCDFQIYEQVEMTKEEYKRIRSDNKGGLKVENTHRVRMYFDHHDGFSRKVVFLTNSKVHVKPEPVEVEVVKPKLKLDPVSTYTPPERTKFDDLKDAIKTGVKIAVAPQLFPTPPDIAKKMHEYLDIQPGDDVLEPSAGTGNLLKNMPCVRPNGAVTAVEINQNLSSMLSGYADHNICDDFLNCNGNLGKFDKIIMNPPFKNGDDIKHINHALTFLKDGGTLVAICANGPRQQAAFQGNADLWEDLPAGSFKDQGTNVNAALIVFNC